MNDYNGTRIQKTRMRLMMDFILTLSCSGLSGFNTETLSPTGFFDIVRCRKPK